MDPPDIVLAALSNGTTASAIGSALPVPWWSFTKTVLAAAALRLVDSGRLTLDDARPGEPWSLRQLLNHTAGVPNYTTLDAYTLAVHRAAPPWTTTEMLARAGAARPAFEPGTKWAYSNTGYAVVRTIIEETAGETIAVALNRLIFAPLGIQNVIVGDSPADLDGCAWGNPTHYHPRYVYHGLLIGPAIAAARTLYGILHPGLLSPPLLAAMCEQIPLGREINGRPGKDIGYGLGLMIALDGPAGRCLGHTGHDHTSVAAVYHYPDQNPPRTVAAFLPGDREAEVEWAAVRHLLPG